MSRERRPRAHSSVEQRRAICKVNEDFSSDNGSVFQFLFVTCFARSSKKELGVEGTSCCKYEA